MRSLRRSRIEIPKYYDIAISLLEFFCYIAILVLNGCFHYSILRSLAPDVMVRVRPLPKDVMEIIGWFVTVASVALSGK